QSDSLARWDADEFMILLPETDFQGANSILARFQAQLEQQDFHFQSQHVHISVRAGIVESRPQEPVELLMDRLVKQLNNTK
ncbi:MAG: diguanylate cyclase, partial [Acidobacteria bacterium]|nr:diguanylate cyclase [Acidobacteriota bacterium]